MIKHKLKKWTQVNQNITFSFERSLSLREILNHLQIDLTVERYGDIDVRYFMILTHLKYWWKFEIKYVRDLLRKKCVGNFVQC